LLLFFFFFFFFFFLVFSKVSQFLRELDVRHAWSVEGLLRVSAPTYAVRGLWAFISSPDFSLVRVSNVHVLASALKLYLREQQQLVLHRALFPQIQAVMKSPSVDEQRSGLKYVVSLMDPVRRLVLHELCWACSKILLFSASNKMDRDNISICLSPSIIDADSDDPMEIALGCSSCSSCVFLVVVGHGFL
jgi:hypothetical protein